jgi:hypothetical protein
MQFAEEQRGEVVGSPDIVGQAAGHEQAVRPKEGGVNFAMP